MLLDRILRWKGVPTSHELLDKLSPAQREGFENEATYIKHTEYYKWLTEDLELMAERWMFKGSKQDLLVGKGMLYCLQIMQSNLNKMAKGNVKADSQEKKKMRRFN